MMQDESEQNYFETSGGAIRIWIEQGTSIHMKAVTSEDDPVELSEAEAIEVSEVLKRFANKI